jgi:hypothetical protein
MIPVVSNIYMFQAGTEIVDVEVLIKTEKQVLSKKIQPSPQPLPLIGKYTNASFNEEVALDETIYYSTELYPSNSYTIRKGIGLQEGKHTLFLTVKVYAQYSPATDTLFIPRNIDIAVTYQPPANPLFTADEYDMLIITDGKFASQLQPLVDHKNSIGVRTVLETTQSIYSNYDGRDKTEDIKLRIKDAIEEWGIKYVLLAGGRKGQTFDWYVPSRTTNNDDGWEGGYESDLYYADVYKE